MIWLNKNQSTTAFTSVLPTYFAVTLSMYTLIPTVYRALLKGSVSGTDHRIHTTKETAFTNHNVFFIPIMFGMEKRYVSPMSEVV